MPSAMKWAIALLAGGLVIEAGWKWAPWLLTVFFVLNCFVLIIVVLLQSGKAADLAGAFGGAGSQTAFGPRGAANVLSRATTWCAIMFMVSALALVLKQDKAVGLGSSVLQNVSKPAPKQSAPAVPGQQPATQPPAAPTQQPPAQVPAGQPVPADQPGTSQSAPAQPQGQQPAPSQGGQQQKPPAAQQPKKP